MYDHVLHEFFVMPAGSRMSAGVWVSWLLWFATSLLLGDAVSRPFRYRALSRGRYDSLLHQAVMFAIFAIVLVASFQVLYLALACCFAAFECLKNRREATKFVKWTPADQRANAVDDPLKVVLEATDPKRNSRAEGGKPQGSGADSPIEVILESAIAKALSAEAGAGGTGTLELRTQVPVGKYTVDMALLGGQISVAVECDGRAFHDSNSEQVTHDRQRDRSLAEQGFVVARFTGSEICADPPRCAREVLAIARRMHDLAPG
ncbi:MAG: endonuclease domain-containing protein [Rhodanobacter sp.]